MDWRFHMNDRSLADVMPIDGIGAVIFLEQWPGPCRHPGSNVSITAARQAGKPWWLFACLGWV
jgi:hypothetical protein